VTRFQLLPGDVVFPMDQLSHPWVVLAWEEGRMLYLGSDGGSLVWEDDEDNEFDPGVLIVRGGEAINGRFP
jgi:hypothetical protein